MLLSFFQSITVFDLITIATLVLLEAILSVDNALVLAILVRRLPENLRRRALTYGLVGAVVFRLLALIFAVYLLQFSVVKLLGGIYLIYISLKHLFLGFLVAIVVMRIDSTIWQKYSVPMLLICLG